MPLTTQIPITGTDKQNRGTFITYNYNGTGNDSDNIIVNLKKNNVVVSTTTLTSLMGDSRTVAPPVYIDKNKYSLNTTTGNVEIQVGDSVSVVQSNSITPPAIKQTCVPNKNWSPTAPLGNWENYITQPPLASVKIESPLVTGSTGEYPTITNDIPDLNIFKSVNDQTNSVKESFLIRGEGYVTPPTIPNPRDLAPNNIIYLNPDKSMDYDGIEIVDNNPSNDGRFPFMLTGIIQQTKVKSCFGNPENNEECSGQDQIITEIVGYTYKNQCPKPGLTVKCGSETYTATYVNSNDCNPSDKFSWKNAQGRFPSGDLYLKSSTPKKGILESQPMLHNDPSTTTFKEGNLGVFRQVALH